MKNFGKGLFLKRLITNYFRKNSYCNYLLALIFVALAIKSTAATYYVSSDGNDEYPGTSTDSSWYSLAKVNSATLQPGDSVLFNRGDEWSGTLTINYSGTDENPITYSAYGTGEKPKIYGSEEITGWTQYSGNIYQASFSEDINQLFVDGEKMTLARTPNSGYYYINSVPSSTEFTFSEWNSTINYIGSTWFGRTGAWTTAVHEVIASSSSTLTLENSPRFSLNTNEGFFLMNKLDFLDSPGEWYYDASSNTVYLLTPTGNSPSNYEVRGSTEDIGILLYDKSYVTISDFEILHFQDKGMKMSYADNLIFDNNEIYFAENFGMIDETYSDGVKITNNTIQGSNGYNIYVRIINSLVEDNQLFDSGLLENMGLDGTTRDYFGGSALIIGTDNIIRYNRINNSGYNGINFAHPNNLVEYNYITNVCLAKGDGGGIYTSWSSTSNPSPRGSIVRNNIVINSTGNMDGYTASRAFGEGIYIDETSEDVLIEGNTVAHISNGGIFLHDNSESEVKGNTVFDARYSVLISHDHGVNTVHDNLFYSFDEDDYEVNQLFVTRTGYETTFDYNQYVNHYNNAQIFKNSGIKYDFDGWKTVTGCDANSTLDITPLGAGETEELFYNDTKQTKNISLGSIVYRDLDGNEVSGTLILESFKSKILIKENQSTDSVPPVINSFVIPSSAESLTIPITSFTATDDQAVTGYILTEAPEAPLAGGGGWRSSAPTSYTFLQEGTMTLYAWVKDAAGNVSDSLKAVVSITLPQVSSVFSEYLFEETSGETVIDSKSSNNGTIINDELRVEGINGNGIELTGSNYITLSQCFGSNVINELTLSAWLKPVGTTGGHQGIIMHGGPNTDSFALYIKPDNKSIGFKTSGTTNDWIGVDSGDALWDGEWHQLTATYDGSEKVIYIDSVVIFNINANGLIDSGEGYNLLIGAGRDENPPKLFYRGLIDEVRIYNYALTKSEVSQLYNHVVTVANTLGNPIGINEFSLFPNPVKSIININYFQSPEFETWIEIYNSTGQSILNRLVESTSNRIDVTQYPSGLYFVRSTNLQKNIVKKFIVE